MNLKRKFNELYDNITFYMIMFGYIVSIVLTVLAWMLFQYPSTCSNNCVISLQNWLLGFAISSTICLVCVGLFLMFSSKINVDLGFVFYIVIGAVFTMFYIIYHWFAYDGLFTKRSTCLTDAPSLWIVTFTIVILQLVAIPSIVLFMMIGRALHKFTKLLPEDDPIQPAANVPQGSQASTTPPQEDDGNIVIEL